ncbi:hypothetical protein BDV19DRAFT_217633 [Aspergillus venezuelensis]
MSSRWLYLPSLTLVISSTENRNPYLAGITNLAIVLAHPRSSSTFAKLPSTNSSPSLSPSPLLTTYLHRLLVLPRCTKEFFDTTTRRDAHNVLHIHILFIQPGVVLACFCMPLLARAFIIFQVWGVQGNLGRYSFIRRPIRTYHISFCICIILCFVYWLVLNLLAGNFLYLLTSHSPPPFLCVILIFIQCLMFVRCTNISGFGNLDWIYLVFVVDIVILYIHSILNTRKRFT